MSQAATTAPAQLELAASAVTTLAAYTELVEAKHGRVEFGVLLLGPRDHPRLITDVMLLHGQKVSYVSFRVPEYWMKQSITSARRLHPGLEIRGLGHLHPGDTFGCAYHSQTDIEHLEGELMPMLAGLSLRPSTWTRVLKPERQAAQWVLPLDAEGRQQVLLDANSAGSQPLRAKLRVTEKSSEIYSLVFTRRLGVPCYCCAMRFRFPMVATWDGEVSVSKVVTRTELEVKLASPPESCARPSPDELQAMKLSVSEQISAQLWGSYAFTSSNQNSSETRRGSGTPALVASTAPSPATTRLGGRSTAELLREAHGYLQQLAKREPAANETIQATSVHALAAAAHDLVARALSLTAPRLN